jgi:hypothetical protein
MPEPSIRARNTSSWCSPMLKSAISVPSGDEPSNRVSTSSLYVVDSSGGTPRKVTADSDAIQPSWSPSGGRIVYWGNINGQRDPSTAGVDDVDIVERCSSANARSFAD